MPPQSYTDITLSDLTPLRQAAHTALVDVRDEWEFDEFNIGGLNIPLADIRTRQSELLSYDALIIICSNGVRSRVAAKDLLRQPALRQKTIYHLHGGLIDAVY